MISEKSIRELRDMSRILIQGSDFVYLLPHPALNNWISNYTITFLSQGTVSDKYAVIPHGCATLVLSFDGTKIFSNLFGPATKLINVGDEANRFRFLFIVEFQPAGYYAFGGMPQNELTDTVIPFETVNPALNRLMANRWKLWQTFLALLLKWTGCFLRI